MPLSLDAPVSTFFEATNRHDADAVPMEIAKVIEEAATSVK